MSRLPLHALIWSSEQSLYELYTQGQLERRFRSADEASWLAWLREVSSFAFHGARGALNVYLERRPRGLTSIDFLPLCAGMFARAAFLSFSTLLFLLRFFLVQN